MDVFLKLLSLVVNRERDRETQREIVYVMCACVCEYIQKRKKIMRVNQENYTIKISVYQILIILISVTL